jgi:hypothetical protein
MTDEDVFVIWSFEHDAWWGPDRTGYTRDLSQAGRYTEADASLIMLRANHLHLNELMMRLKEAQMFVGVLP